MASDSSIQDAISSSTGGLAVARTAAKPERLQVISLISANVEADVSTVLYVMLSQPGALHSCLAIKSIFWLT